MTYITCSLLSLFTGVLAIAYGFPVWRKWDPSNASEEQYRLEKKVYLIITVLSTGFLLRLIMVPLWFLALYSMIISIPGAMCLVGVHNSQPHISYISSSLKIILPALYFYWLVINRLDRKLAAPPFMKQKLFLLTPLGIFVLVEAFLDISFFFSIPPRQVSCCTSLFDIPREDIIQTVTAAGWIWVYLFYILAVIILGWIVYFLVYNKKNTPAKPVRWLRNKAMTLIQTILTASFLVVFILALHTRISPLFLHTPFHHCIFCLFQKMWDATISFILIYSGSIMFMSYMWVVSSSNYQEVEQALGYSAVKLLKWSGGMLSAGLVILSVHLCL
jgi:hypothetical protein